MKENELFVNFKHSTFDLYRSAHYLVQSVMIKFDDVTAAKNHQSIFGTRSLMSDK